MTTGYRGSLLMLSLHGYVAAKPELGLPDTGGQVTFVIELARRFARLGYQVDVVTRQFEGQRAVERLNSGARILRIPFGGKEFIRKEDMHDHLTEFVTNFLTTTARSGREYDTVNSHYWDAGWAGQRIAEELGIPHIHTPHSLGKWKQTDMRSIRDQDPEATNGYRFEERIQREFLVYRSCDHLIATSYQQADILRASYDMRDQQITMIPPGIDESRFTPVPSEEIKKIRRRIKFRQHDVYAVGRAATNKGYDLLIESLPALRQIVPDARVQLAVGANSPADERLIADWKQRAQALCVEEHVIWRNYIPDEQMPNYYRAAAVFALCSRYEPFGMTAIEAMACGTPTVVTANGGLREMLNFGTQALFADPTIPQEFAGMLAMPMRYPELAGKLSNEGSRFARREFGWTGIAKRTANIFEHFRGAYTRPDDAVLSAV
ncbi:MAG: glycosyltransferase [Chloroflexi bacterium]|nr:glycosyltransferase [Chloroflexota bacterium]MDA1145296.1 glycosyltransferase [Chloroflexota bacterium]